MERKEREEILRRVMAVLVEDDGGKMVLSKEVVKIMTSFPNVKIVEGQELLPSKSHEQLPLKSQDQSPSKSQEQLPSKSEEQSPSKSQEQSPKSTDSSKITYVKMESPEEYDQNIKKRIEMILKLASAGGEPILQI